MPQNIQGVASRALKDNPGKPFCCDCLSEKARITSPEDRQALEVLRKVQKKLKDQSEELQAFWKTGEKEHGEKYEAIRKEAWQSIRTLLGLTE